MTKVIVNLVGDKENLKTPAVTIDKARWGHNGHTTFGKEQEVTAGTHTATIYSDGKVHKTKEVTVSGAGPVTLNLSVD
ncbi:hypothetical protein [Ralstonia mojiangensis]|uniref:Uncharacterized protein n=1 Tax=Ralstonia mojiangensis TaxID=2953895 RepID=A0ABT2LEG9_9RALS|nr:hypothetical protein [Ralstonia mojiangensis]MCO5411195.1 hypothetical protein [Ralstonia mojiangensis]MCT7313801.1 hypothetical protein [Ralstonia mojiangensis]